MGTGSGSGSGTGYGTAAAGHTRATAVGRTCKTAAAARNSYEGCRLRDLLAVKFRLGSRHTPCYSVVQRTLLASQLGRLQTVSDIQPLELLLELIQK